jgi:thiol-disulfide isomerase/thioredoxin
VTETTASATTLSDGSRARRPRSRRVYLVVAGIVAVVAVAAILIAAGSNPSAISGRVDVTNLPDDGPAPQLAAKGWINTPPLTAADLRGKVVLYDIWTYSCINCVRTFPFIRAWYDRYRPDGLVVVGVHSPEFDFEKVHDNVAKAVKHLDVTWPVALDDDMTIWNEFKNRYWPADYVADRNGHLRYSHFGEGDYENTENVLRSLLGVPASAPRATLSGKTETASKDALNPETYLGTERSEIGTESGLRVYPPVGNLVAPNVALEGPWNGAPEKVTSAAPGADIAAGVIAQSTNLVMAPADGRAMNVIVTIDGAPVPPRLRGADVDVDRMGRTVVTVSRSDMYRLIQGPGVEHHQLHVIAEQPGLEAYAFTFG